MTTRASILDTAKQYVTADRQAVHGSPENNFGTIAAYWTAHLDHPVTTTDVAAMLTMLKLARIKANPQHPDNWIDGAGYLACGGELAHQDGQAAEATACPACGALCEPGSFHQCPALQETGRAFLAPVLDGFKALGRRRVTADHWRDRQADQVAELAADWQQDAPRPIQADQDQAPALHWQPDPNPGRGFRCVALIPVEWSPGFGGEYEWQTLPSNRGLKLEHQAVGWLPMFHELTNHSPTGRGA